MRILTLVALAAFATAAHALEYLKLEQLDTSAGFSPIEVPKPYFDAVVEMTDGSLAGLNTYRRCVYLIEKGQTVVLAGREDSSGDHLGQGDEAKFTNPTAMVLDQSTGDLLVMDAGAKKLLRVSREGKVTLVRKFTDETQTPFSLDSAPDGTLYSLCLSGRIYRYRADSDLLDYVETGLLPEREANPFVGCGAVAPNSTELIAFMSGYTKDFFWRNFETLSFEPNWEEHLVGTIHASNSGLISASDDASDTWGLRGAARDLVGNLYILSTNFAGFCRIERVRTNGELETIESADAPFQDFVGLSIVRGNPLMESLWVSGFKRIVDGQLVDVNLIEAGIEAVEGRIASPDVYALSVGHGGEVNFIPSRTRSIESWSSWSGVRTLLASFDSDDIRDSREDRIAGDYYRQEITSDLMGNLYFADANTTVIRRSRGDGSSEIYAGAPYESSQVDGLRVAMRFTHISSLSMAPDGSLYIADAGSLRVISPAGEGSTLIPRTIPPDEAGYRSYFRGEIQRVTVSPGGTVYLSDGYSVQKLVFGRQLALVAGNVLESGYRDGVGERARFSMISSLAADRSGNIYVSDGYRIRVIKSSGEVKTLVGTRIGFDEPAAQEANMAQIYSPMSLAVGPNDELYLGGYGVFKATLLDTANDPIRIVNFSARGQAMDDEANLILGFGTSGSGAVLLGRGIGPSLAQFGIKDPLASTGVVFLEADGFDNKANLQWRGDPFLEDLSSRCGAFALAEDSLEGVALTKVATGNGFLTLREPAAAGGTALLELYDVNRSTDAELSNCSVRGFAGDTANALAAGLVLEGKGVKKILIRAAGPALSDFHLAHVLQKPKIRVFRNRQLLAEKAGWENDSAVSDATARVGAFAFRTGSHDSALVLDLPAGDYTAEVEGVDGASGVVLLELYEIP